MVAADVEHVVRVAPPHVEIAVGRHHAAGLVGAADLNDLERREPLNLLGHGDEGQGAVDS